MLLSDDELYGDRDLSNGTPHEREVRDAFLGRGITGQTEILPTATVTHSLNLTPGGPYVVGQQIAAHFEISNKGPQPVTLDTLTVGGRLDRDSSCNNIEPKPNPNTPCADFTWRQNIVLEVGESYEYQGDLHLLQPGD